jgi:hypothetical protein
MVTPSVVCCVIQPIFLSKKPTTLCYNTIDQQFTLNGQAFLHLTVEKDKYALSHSNDSLCHIQLHSKYASGYTISKGNTYIGEVKLKQKRWVFYFVNPLSHLVERLVLYPIHSKYLIGYGEDEQVMAWIIQEKERYLMQVNEGMDLCIGCLLMVMMNYLHKEEN